MPPGEIIDGLGLRLPLLRRDPHYFLPTTGQRYLLFGSDAENTRRQFVDFFSEKRIFHAHEALQTELAALRADVAPTWLREPLSIEDTAARYVRPALRSVFVDLCRKLRARLSRSLRFRERTGRGDVRRHGRLLPVLSATWDTPGTGMNFLVHNMCRLPVSDGTWMIVQGGMGVVSDELARVARAHGADIETNAGVRSISTSGGRATGVVLTDGRVFTAKTVVVNADPFRMREVSSAKAACRRSTTRASDGYRRDGMTLKVNLALSALPKFTCLPFDPVGQHHTTIHLLPEHDVIEGLEARVPRRFRGAAPRFFPAIEWYIHTSIDPSLQDQGKHHNSALFVQWVPYDIAGSSWEAEEERYVRHLLLPSATGSPQGTTELVVDRFTLHPRRIEERTSESREATSTTSTTRSVSPIGCPSRRRSPGSTRRAPRATPVARSSAPPGGSRQGG